jgi:hypothetical protein
MPATIRRYHANSGIKFTRMPGARHFMIPTISSTAAASEATSMKERPSSQMSAPMPACSDVANGGYMNQPELGAAPKKIEPHTKTPPMRKLQKPKAPSRGNGISRAPIIGGSKKIATASKIGTAKRNIITVPCSV